MEALATLTEGEAAAEIQIKSVEKLTFWLSVDKHWRDSRESQKGGIPGPGLWIQEDDWAASCIAKWYLHHQTHCHHGDPEEGRACIENQPADTLYLDFIHRNIDERWSVVRHVSRSTICTRDKVLGYLMVQQRGVWVYKTHFRAFQGRPSLLGSAQCEAVWTQWPERPLTGPGGCALSI